MNMPETYESLNEHPPTSNVQRMTLIPFVNSQVVEQVNNEIHSGENYRIYNGAMTNFNSRMKIYDEIILGSADTLQKLYHHNREDHLIWRPAQGITEHTIKFHLFPNRA